jgi:hypothetical protein
MLFAQGARPDIAENISALKSPRLPRPTTTMIELTGFFARLCDQTP